MERGRWHLYGRPPQGPYRQAALDRDPGRGGRAHLLRFRGTSGSGARVEVITDRDGDPGLFARGRSSALA